MSAQFTRVAIQQLGYTLKIYSRSNPIERKNSDQKVGFLILIDNVDQSLKDKLALIRFSFK